MQKKGQPNFPRKKLVFHTESCDLFKSLTLIYSSFHRVKELFKSNQTRYGVFQVYIESRGKRISGINCLWKKLLLSLFYFI